MTFQPVLPLGGIPGWNLLNRTIERQSASFADSPQITRETEYFRANISKIKTAEDLVANRELLIIALGAFGLDEDINKQFFVRKVLEEGTDDGSSFANRLVDNRYAKLADAFGFGSALGRRTNDIGFASKIISAYETRQFEIALGGSNESMRLALTFRREITDIASGSSTGDAGWFSLLGSAPLREVVQQAFNLPSAFVTLEIDKQVETLKAKSRTLFGSESVDVFSNPVHVEAAINQFLARADNSVSTAGITSGNAVALGILQQGNLSGAGTIEALFAVLY